MPPCALAGLNVAAIAAVMQIYLSSKRIQLGSRAYELVDITSCRCSPGSKQSPASFS